MESVSTYNGTNAGRGLRDLRLAPFATRLSPKLPYQIVIVALIALLAVQCARILWAVVTPVGALGDWRPASGAVTADEMLLTRFDPFFRLGGPSTPAVVTSLSVKLFGVRVNQATGQGSAIIETPDGVQGSYAVGDEVLPGVKLKAVAFDGITLDRSGVSEQVFLDQSVAAAIAQPGAAPIGSSSASALANDVAFTPRIVDGQSTGLIVSPKGTGAAFTAAGLKAGDVLVAVNGQSIKSIDDVMNVMPQAAAGGTVTLSIERGGATMTLSAKVAP